MNSKLKVMISAVGLAALAFTVLSSTAPASAQSRARILTPRGSIYGPLHNPAYFPPYDFTNGTGTVPDARRDPHNDR